MQSEDGGLATATGKGFTVTVVDVEAVHPLLSVAVTI
jgi:hypothetical protein